MNNKYSNNNKVDIIIIIYMNSIQIVGIIMMLLMILWGLIRNNVKTMRMMMILGVGIRIWRIWMRRMIGMGMGKLFRLICILRVMIRLLRMMMMTMVDKMMMMMMLTPNSHNPNPYYNPKYQAYNNTPNHTPNPNNPK